MFDGEFVTWTTDGANAGTVFYRSGKFNITNVCGLLSVSDKAILMSKYLFYFLQKNAKAYVNSGMGNPKLMSNVMASIKIHIPSLQEQIRIVDILDRFDSLCNDISSGLPAEIEARQKQYEYYRDKLLTFKEQ
jgi:type I restriction enzyme, S subunit